MRVAGIGQCSWDYLGVVDSFPAVDTKAEIRNWHEEGGGPVATALVALARFGIPCSFSGVVGDDSAGEKIRQSLKAEGVDVTGLLTRGEASSQLAFIAIEKTTAKRTIFWKRPSGIPLQPNELPPHYLVGVDLLHLDGLMTEVSLYAARQARKAGIPIMVDAGRVRPGMLELIRYCDYVVVSEEFAAETAPDWQQNPDPFIQQLQLPQSAILTITLGERGSVTFVDGAVVTLPAFAVEAVDTTGAGDVFHGAFIFGLLQKWPVADTIRFASACAALKCRRIGGRSGIPTLIEALDFLKERGFRLQASSF